MGPWQPCHDGLESFFSISANFCLVMALNCLSRSWQILVVVLVEWWVVMVESKAQSILGYDISRYLQISEIKDGWSSVKFPLRLTKLRTVYQPQFDQNTS